MKLNEYQNTIYIKLQSVNLPATVTNKISNVAERLVGDFIKCNERGVIYISEFVSKICFRPKKE
jgi:hypothetical protein